jgi:hypothetical protein
MTGVEVRAFNSGDDGRRRTLCNQYRPADGAYAY